MELLPVDFVVTVDRTLMTDHHGREFIGFMTTAPPILFPERVWMWLAAPKPKVDRYGRPRVAPYGLRKVEAALIDRGFKAAIIDPDYLEPYLERAKAVLIGHHDYFAFCPPSCQWWMLTGKEPVNRKNLIRLMERIARVKVERNPELKIIVAGPAAWQWLHVPKFIERFAVDCIVEGESGEKVIPWLASRILAGEDIPRYIYVGAVDSPSVDEIPVIKAPSVNALVEVSRGCPRGCKFCSVTLRPFRHIPLEKVRAELELHKRHGFRSTILHAEDVLLYGASGINVNPEAVLKLHRMAKGMFPTVAWSHAALATVVHAQREYKLITKLHELLIDDSMRFLGFQTGIETGSPRLLAQSMRGKAAPFKPEEWPDVVEEAFAILHEHDFIPAATLIIGVPGEKPEDVEKTIELVERLRPYRSLIIPLFFVPMGLLRREDWFRAVELRREHAELMVVCLRHSLYWARRIVGEYIGRSLAMLPVRVLVELFIRAGERWAARLTADDILARLEEVRRASAEIPRGGRGIAARVRAAVRSVARH